METATKKNKKLIIEQPDFRAYQPEWVDEGSGQEVLLQECEDLVPESGRWEPFIATLKRRQKQEAK